MGEGIDYGSIIDELDKRPSLAPAATGRTDYDAIIGEMDARAAKGGDDFRSGQRRVQEIESQLTLQEKQIVNYHRNTIASGKVGRDEQGNPVTVYSVSVGIPSGPNKGKFVTVPGYYGGERHTNDDEVFSHWRSEIDAGKWPVYDTAKSADDRAKFIHGIMDVERGGVDDFRAVIREQDAQDRSTLSATLLRAKQANPDQYAETMRKAGVLGVAPGVVEAAPAQTDQQLTLQHADHLLKNSPALARQMLNPEFSKIAHDNTDNLSLLEKLSNAWNRGLKTVDQIAPVLNLRSAAQTMSVLDDADKGKPVMPGLRGPDPLGMRFLQPEERKAVSEERMQSASASAADLARLETEKRAIPTDSTVAAAMQAKSFSEFWQHFKKKPAEFIATVGLESLPASSLGMAAALPASFIAGPAGAAAGMGVGSLVTDYASQILQYMQDAGVDTTKKESVLAAVQNKELMARIGAQAAAHASGVAAFDAASGGLASKTLAPKAIRSTFGREMTNIAAQAPIQGTLGALGEAVGSTMAGKQFNAGDVMAEFFGEFVSTPGDVLSASAGRVYDGMLAADRARENAAIMEQITKLAQADKVLQRDPASFASFMQSAAERSDVKEIWVDAQALSEAVQKGQIPNVPASVQEQLAEAVDRHGDVAVPIGEYTAQIATSPAGPELNKHIKLDPGEMTLTQAETFYQEQMETFKQEAEKAITDTADQVQAQQAHDELQQIFTDQLNTAGRFTPDVNKAKAAYAAAFFTTMGNRVHMTGKEFLQRYVLRVQSQNVAGANTLDQTSPEFTRFISGSKVPNVMYHGTSSDTDFSKFNVGESGAWFTPDAALASDYANENSSMYAGEPGANQASRVMPVYLSVKNPYVPTEADAAALANSGDHMAEQARIAQRAKEAGHDGIVYHDGTTVVFSPEQIKSAITLNQSGRKGGDVTYSLLARRILDDMGELPELSSVGIMEGKQSLPKIDGLTGLAAYFTKLNRKAAADLDNKKVRERIVSALYSEALYALTDSGNAIGWYDRKTRAALQIIAEAHPEILTDEQSRFGFTAILAITSNGLRSRDNFVIAERLYREAKGTNKFPEKVPDGGPRLGAMEEKFALLNQLIDKHGWQAVRDFMTSRHSAKDIKAFVGANSFFGEQAGSELNGSLFLGAKIGSFFNNLYGDHSTFTMDRWFMRTINRIRGRMLVLPGAFDINLGKLAAQLTAGTNTFGISKEKMLAEIKAFGRLKHEQQADVMVARSKLKTVAEYTHLRFNDYSRPVTGTDGKKHSFYDRSPENVLAKILHQSFTASKDSPFGAKDRTGIRSILQEVQARMNSAGIEIENADLQAVLWYYEKDLHARVTGEANDQSELALDNEEENEDAIEAEDYETAARYAVALLREQGIIAGSAGRGGLGSERGTEPGGSAQVAGSAATLNQGPAGQRQADGQQGARVLFEVAPDPSNQKLTARWDALADERKFAISRNVTNVIIPKILKLLKVEGQVVEQIGGFEGSTNPSFALVLAHATDAAKVIEATKLAGFALSQKSMVTVTPSPFEGGEKVGVVTVALPAASDLNFVRNIYDALWQLKHEGQNLVGGHTTINGKMAILNYSGLTDEQLAQRVADQLNGEYPVSLGTGYAWFPGKEQYDYGNMDGRPGQTVPAGSPLRAAANNLRAEASQLIEAELARAEAGEPAGSTTGDQARLAQSDENAPPRGQIDFGFDITKEPSVITLLQDADLSTFFHEAGHFYLEVLFDLAGQVDTPADIARDAQVVLDWFGIKDLISWHAMTLEQKRPYHEQWAQGNEKYIFEGRAPSLELQPLFNRFREWMKWVYKAVTRQLNVKLNDEVRGVMDRMLASEEEIKAAENARGLVQLFQTAEEAGMTPQEWAAYQALGQDATEDATRDLERKSMNDMRWLSNARSRVLKELQAKANAHRKAVRDEISKEVHAEKIYAAQQGLLHGWKQDDGSVVNIKFSTSALNEMYPPTSPTTPADLMQKLHGMTNDKTGAHPDVVAQLTGFSSGDELVRKLIDAEPMQSVIDGRTDQRMLEQHGEMIDQRAIEREADKAVHNEMRGRAIATELNALARAMQKTAKTPAGATYNVLVKAAKEYAAIIIGRKKIRDVRPAQYVAAETRAAKATEAAIKNKKNKFTEAVTEKRNQLINHYAARAAYEAIDGIEKGLRYLKSLDGNQKIDIEYRDQIDQILERFDLRTGQSLKAIDKRTSLAKWIEEQEKQGYVPTIDESLREEAFRKHYQDLTVEEFRGLVAGIKNIVHIGKLKKQLLTAKDQREFDDAKKDIVDAIEANAKKTIPEQKATDRGPLVEPSRVFRAAMAIHRKFASIVRQLDGHKDGGTVWEYLSRAMNERGDWEVEQLDAANRALFKLLDPVSKAGKFSEKKFFASVGKSFTREERIGMLLNMGNGVNLERQTTGERLTPEQLHEIVGTLTKADTDFVNQMWGYLDSFRPLIAAKERRLTGAEPEWVEAQPFELTLSTGDKVQMRGGYYPIAYDPWLSERSNADINSEVERQMQQGFYANAQTRRGHLKARTESTGRRLRYDFADVIVGHLNQVIHDLAWHEYLIDANRLLRATEIETAIRDHYGVELLREMKSTLTDIAIGSNRADMGAAFFNRIRFGTTIVGLAFNVFNTFQNLTGITQSMSRIGTKWVLKGAIHWAGDAAHFESAVKTMQEKSSQMRMRAVAMQRDIHDIRNQITGKSTKIQAAFFLFQTKTQLMVDTPTWWGAYEKAMSGPNMSEDKAIALADQAVIDAQGGGQIKDQARIQRGPAALKAFTTFYSFFSTTFNLSAEAYQRTNFKQPGDVALFAADVALLYMAPALLSTLLKAGLQGDWDDEEKLMKKILADQIGYLLGTMVVVRELAGALKEALGVGDGYGYTGPAGIRLLADAYNLGKQVNQGEADEPFWKALDNVGGVLFHYPAGQINRTVSGINALYEGTTSNPMALLMGPPPKK